MDFGVIKSEGGGGGEGNVASESFGINNTTVQKSQGSGVLKTQRSDSAQESLRINKAVKTEEFCLFSQGQSPGFLRSDSGLTGNNGQTMISFSSQSQGPVFSDEDASKTYTIPFFLAPPDPPCSRTSSLPGSATEKSTEVRRGAFTRFRGPFSPSQWMELEHQALIYKHIMANVPVPSHLLIPLRKAFNPYAFSSFSAGSYGFNSLGWGSFHLGFSGCSDPVPERCRRTDGKKWRCSRDAVPDQKYCERHINRGRYRSRKHVEGQNGQAVSGSTTSKEASIASASTASMMSSSSVYNSLSAVQQHSKNLLSGAADTSSDNNLLSRMQDLQGLPMVGATINFNPKVSTFSAQKQHSIFGGSQFGVLSPDSLLNPSEKSSSMLSSKNSDSFLGFNNQNPPNQHPLWHFIHNWPEDQSDRAPVTWPEGPKSDWTHLSMSICMSAAGFSSSSNSPGQEKPTLSPLRLARDTDPIQMGLSVSNRELISESNQKEEANCLPVAWGNSFVGGPLGEVLNSTPISTAGSMKNNPSWDNSPQTGCSPTGVLQNSTFVSLSNSSSGSSPRADNNNNNVTERTGNGFHSDDLGNSSVIIPSL